MNAFVAPVAEMDRAAHRSSGRVAQCIVSLADIIDDWKVTHGVLIPLFNVDLLTLQRN
jgi:hypothetical protein